MLLDHKNQIQILTAFISLTISISAQGANDPYLKNQDSLRHSGVIEAENKLFSNLKKLEPDLVVGVIDMGSVNPDHEDLKDRILPGSSISQSHSDIHHGQFVTGILAARADNGIGIRGALGHIGRVLFKKTTSAKEMGDHILNMASNGVSVINISLGTEKKCISPHATGPKKVCQHPCVELPAVASAISTALLRYGTVVIISAGNDNDRISYSRQQSEGLIVVGASGSESKRDYSNYGPGISIFVRDSGIYGTSYSGYKKDSATSFTTPIATATAALAVAYFKLHGIKYSPMDIKNLILSSARYSSSLEGKAEQAGILDASRMADKILTMVQPPQISKFRLK